MREICKDKEDLENLIRSAGAEFQAVTRHFFDFVSERIMRTAFLERDRAVAIESPTEEQRTKCGRVNGVFPLSEV